MPIEDNSASVRGYWQARIAADTFAKSVGTFRSRAERWICRIFRRQDALFLRFL